MRCSKSILREFKFCAEIVAECMELKIKMDFICSTALGIKTHNYFNLIFRRFSLSQLKVYV